MSFSIVPIINSISNIESMSFLELGVWDGKNHGMIHCRDKASVDIDWHPTFKMTTNEFFKRNDRRWDIVFIDADHRLPGGLSDYNQSTLICDKMIVMHDLWPDNEQQATETGNYAGDVWKIMYHIITHEIPVEYYVCDGDCGLTVFFPPFKTIPLLNVDRDVKYRQLCELEIERYDIEGMQEILRNKL